MNRVRHWFGHTWVRETHWAYWHTSDCEHMVCSWCGARRLRDPRSGIMFGPEY